MAISQQDSIMEVGYLVLNQNRLVAKYQYLRAYFVKLMLLFKIHFIISFQLREVSKLIRFHLSC